MQSKEYQDYFKSIIIFTIVFMSYVLVLSICLTYRTSISAAGSTHLTFLDQQARNIETSLARYGDDILFLTETPPIQGLLHSSELSKSQKGREIYIVDQNGFYLHHHSDPEKEWGSCEDLNTGKSLKTFQPDLFKKIMNNDSGMEFSLDSYSFVLFSRVNFPDTKDKYLVIVSEISPYIILAPMIRTIIIILYFSLFFSIILFFFIRHAARQIHEKQTAFAGSEARFSKLIKATTDAILIVDKEGFVQFRHGSQNSV